MKVKEFLDRFNMGSNAIVTVCDESTEELKEYRLFYDQMRQMNYTKYDGSEKIDLGALKLNTFSVRDNRITIYAE